MSSSKGSDIHTDTDILHSAAFEQIQESGDIISSILILVKFIQENNLSVGFDPSKLRQIALRSVDGETSTYLWHINAVIAASSDFERLVIGIGMMFDRFLGNRACFIKEREKRENATESAESNQKSLSTPKPTKFLGNEIVSFVNSYYDDRADSVSEETAQKIPAVDSGLAVVTEDVATPGVTVQRPRAGPRGNDENQSGNVQSNQRLRVEENEEFMQKYRGKVSSPISFRMRQQKRMMQSERRGSQSNSRNVSMLDFDDSMSDLNIHAMAELTVQPEIDSPFNVTKFAKTVDFGADQEVQDGQ